ncbi:hypothetical protein Ltuc_2912 [Legionella tucsonensis]|uniref:Acyl carrier protein n=2 Tax=Legionella tucsonensis TaxID=40335 RepID=A0A0W0ZNT1_9GAMM|nr:hypothetical protein Ltuc_2912 [Legionella tucsonensis]
MEQTVEHRVIHLIARTQKIAPEGIDLDQSIDQVVPSSLDLVNFFFDLEDEFDLDIRNDIGKEKTIREITIDIKELIAKKTKYKRSCTL